jgi:amino acid transporter
MKPIGRILFGPSKDPTKAGTLHQLQLIAVFAWVGLGADGLSSACYGPEEAFLGLEGRSFLVVPLAALVVLTVVTLSASYSRIIEKFPAGGGGYIVTSTLLGKWPGLVCGCALVVDYVLTITISVASGVDQIFSFLPQDWQPLKLLAAVAVLSLLVILNLRGVKESILILLPIFVAFLVTHLVVIAAAFFRNLDHAKELYDSAVASVSDPAPGLGFWGLAALLLKAFSHGAGTFTGIEAVSNSTQILREPRVQTARRTMVYMAASLAVIAGGILVGYALARVSPEAGRTLNAVLFDRATAGWPGAKGFVVAGLLAAGALLFVAAQAGFISGPRTLATMAHDGWVPRRFAHLSHRLVVADGVVIMAVASLVFLLATQGNVKLLVVLYSINVFITFTLAQASMCRHWLAERRRKAEWRAGLGVNGAGLAISVFILCTMVYFKFEEGGWATLLVTAGLLGLCVTIRRHYDGVSAQIRDLDKQMKSIQLPEGDKPLLPRVQDAPTAVILVPGFTGLGLHTLLTLHRLFPAHYRNFVFVSVGHIDYDRIHGEEQIEKLRQDTLRDLNRYEPFARALDAHFEARFAMGPDIAEALIDICKDVAGQYRGALVFGSKLVLKREPFWTRLLHNQVVYEIERRLHQVGIPMLILPTQL